MPSNELNSAVAAIKSALQSATGGSAGDMAALSSVASQLAGDAFVGIINPAKLLAMSEAFDVVESHRRLAEVIAMGRGAYYSQHSATVPKELARLDKMRATLENLVAVGFE